MTVKQPHDGGHRGRRSASTAMLGAFLSLAAASLGGEEARANPNAGLKPAAPSAPDAGPAPKVNLAPGIKAPPSVEPGAGAGSTADMDTWHAQALSLLSASLERYEAIAKAGGWSTVPPGPTLKPGMVDARVPLVRQRLEITGDMPPANLPVGPGADAQPNPGTTEAAANAENAAPPSAAPAADPLLFDAALAAGVRAFQARHGLTTDGFVGRQTLAALNVPVSARLRTLNLNKTRIQTFKPWGPSYVLVIVPGFEARLIRELEPVLKTRVIVGEPGWPTPQLNGMLSRVEVNPYWNVPRSILIREIIPRMQRDPGYLARENIRVFTGWDANAREVDPAQVDWSGPAVRTYRLRQDPGPHNALGNFKFTFRNSESIYLHDTRSRRLFDRSARALSHGCVRVEQPFELAELLLAGQGGWDADALKRAMSRGTNRGIVIERPLPVHLVYWTAWADEDGRTQFRNDIYNRDSNVYAPGADQQRGT